MKTIDWKLLGAGDIELRPVFYKDKDGNYESKVGLLLYQNARTAMSAFDEQFGEFGWTIEYKNVGDTIYGRLSVKDKETGEWIFKEDTGEEANISQDKSIASDIMKRCAVKWGYGRELYTSPKIYVENDGYNCAGYKVSKISYDENRRICDLVITDRWGNVKWTMNGEKKPAATTTQKPAENKTKVAQIEEFCVALSKDVDEQTKADLRAFYKHYTQGKGKGKIENWKGVLSPSQLWQNWQSKKWNSNNNQNGILETKPELAYIM